MNAVVRITTDDIALPRYERMCKAIAICHRIDEVKEIQDRAAALRAYARQIHNRQAEVQFAEIKARAERRSGQLLEEMKETGERATTGQTTRSKVKIKDLGLTQMDAHRFRQTAKVPEERFESHLAERRASLKPVTSSSVRSLLVGPPGSPAELRIALATLETLSDLNVTPAQFAKFATGPTRERVTRALTNAVPWLAAVSRLLQVTSTQPTEP